MQIKRKIKIGDESDQMRRSRRRSGERETWDLEKNPSLRAAVGAITSVSVCEFTDANKQSYKEGEKFKISPNDANSN